MTRCRSSAAALSCLVVAIRTRCWQLLQLEVQAVANLCADSYFEDGIVAFIDTHFWCDERIARTSSNAAQCDTIMAHKCGVPAHYASDVMLYCAGTWQPHVSQRRHAEATQETTGPEKRNRMADDAADIRHALFSLVQCAPICPLRPSNAVLLLSCCNSMCAARH